MNEVTTETPSVIDANGKEIDLKAILAGKVNQEGVEGEDSAPVKTDRPN